MCVHHGGPRPFVFNAAPGIISLPQLGHRIVSRSAAAANVSDCFASCCLQPLVISNRLALSSTSAQSATILHLPPTERSEKLTEPPTASDAAHVFSIQEWNEKKMGKKENDPPGCEKPFKPNGRQRAAAGNPIAYRRERENR